MPVIASTEPKLTVYRFRVYDIRDDDFKLSARYATREIIAKIGGEPVGGGYEIPEADAPSGFTDRGYDPER